MKVKFTILILAIAMSLMAIAFFSSKETSFILLDASELASHPDKYDGDNLRVRGLVKIGSVVREGRQAKFTIELNDKEVPVNYSGKELLPDAFKEGVRVRVDGKFKNGVLVGDHVEAKCASKYEAEYKNEP
ncbi:MAG TPA: cytochrome c maturation protein CcmE [Leptospiraceae bacterium]|nr:cytochrome c maturation protein CcmE [Leptospiraceae bacterium]HMW05820.1 cytochrome c maturation protein CcmE [Leptospiraceae bacterium]HMX34090.1 cytochrome c maturation protein CcmE [Leptospiraceae bacterium]HMY33898.1 cytochrome c maturation protein CcmE [Leptospiraceae bacterium]HMZ65866.1 cytochrome c maturation protein CcmE [Leptospiraceae bacterium]